MSISVAAGINHYNIKMEISGRVIKQAIRVIIVTPIAYSPSLPPFLTKIGMTVIVGSPDISTRVSFILLLSAKGSKARWKIIGNNIIFTRMPI